MMQNLQTLEAARTHYNEDLHAYLVKVYNYMAVALALTGFVAWFGAHSSGLIHMMYVMQGDQIISMKPLTWIIMGAPLLFVALMTGGIRKMSITAMHTTFWSYAALMGLSFSIFFLTFTGESIAHVFFITAGMFMGMSLYGHTTKKNLTELGSFLIMALFGIILVSLLNLFVNSSGLYFVTSTVGMLIFIGLTAADTQQLKTMFNQAEYETARTQQLAILGALTLYLDFINIFINLLPFLGRRK